MRTIRRNVPRAQVKDLRYTVVADVFGIALLFLLAQAVVVTATARAENPQNGTACSFLGGAITNRVRVAGMLTPEMILSAILGAAVSRSDGFVISRRRNVVHNAALTDASRSCNAIS